jgi:hypothetical protein
MNKWDRVNVSVLSRRYICAIQGRNELAAEETLIACAGCGIQLVFRNGIWTSGENQR